jgi:hypothetical protein
LWTAFVDEHAITDLMATVPAFFGKLSLAWPAILTILTNKEIRKKIYSTKKAKKEVIVASGNYRKCLKITNLPIIR